MVVDSKVIQGDPRRSTWREIKVFRIMNSFLFKNVVHRTIAPERCVKHVRSINKQKKKKTSENRRLLTSLAQSGEVKALVAHYHLHNKINQGKEGWLPYFTSPLDPPLAVTYIVSKRNECFSLQFGSADTTHSTLTWFHFYVVLCVVHSEHFRRRVNDVILRLVRQWSCFKTNGKINKNGFGSTPSSSRPRNLFINESQYSEIEIKPYVKCISILYPPLLPSKLNSTYVILSRSQHSGRVLLRKLSCPVDCFRIFVRSNYCKNIVSRISYVFAEQTVF